MELNEMFVKSNYSIEDLEQFRDEKGFIDLTKAGIKFTDESREIVGEPDRIKNWVNFKGTKALIKGETLFDNEKNYGIYAELIVEEIAKAKGIPTAHYDLIKSINEDGEEVLGVLSVSIVNTDKGQRLESLRSIIGDEPEEEAQYPDITTYEYTVSNLEEKLLADGIDAEEINKVISDYKKRLVFSLSVLGGDNHTQNVAFIREKIDGVDTIHISPNFDNESCLILDSNISTIERLLQDYEALKESARIIDPKIGTWVSKEDGGHESLWMDTLELLCEDDEIYDYYMDNIRNPVDIDDILDSVEKRIGAKLPENVRLLAKYSYQIRNEDMQKVMDGEILEQDEDEFGFDISSLLSILVDDSERAGIRSGEQMDIGKTMETDIELLLRGTEEKMSDEIKR